jgi:hypothetical protein
MTLLTMRQEYEQIRGSWRSRPPAEHRFDLARLRELRTAAVDSVDQGTEQLVIEIEDLIGQIQHTSLPVQRDRQTAYHEPSDAM